jgi:hypothetical protein
MTWTNFKSKKLFYIIRCPNDFKESVDVYVNKVESFLPVLRKTFSLNPSYNELNVEFGEKGPCYQAGGFIYLPSPSRMDTNEPENIYGGLFHETIHAFLEKYIHRPDGSNEFPESCAIILQIAALDKINKEWSNRFAEGIGCCESDHKLLFELVRIYRQFGFDPIRLVYKKMYVSRCPILFKNTFISDLNKVLEEYSEKIRIEMN